MGGGDKMPEDGPSEKGKSGSRTALTRHRRGPSASSPGRDVPGKEKLPGPSYSRPR